MSHQAGANAWPDGRPLRAEDLQPLGKFFKRGEWATNAPAKQARAGPERRGKTATDAWSGHHSAPLGPEGHHIMTSPAPWGRHHYLQNPQGFIGAGEGRNRGFDAIRDNLRGREGRVNDAVFWDAGRERHWRRAAEFLESVGMSDLIPMFRSCAKDVKFAGSRVASTKATPLPTLLDAVKLFPTPKDLTDTWSRLRRVNQDAYYSQLCRTRDPCNPFLNPKGKLERARELQSAATTDDAYR